MSHHHNSKDPEDAVGGAPKHTIKLSSSEPETEFQALSRLVEARLAVPDSQYRLAEFSLDDSRVTFVRRVA